jgi:hypothetical protein
MTLRKERLEIIMEGSGDWLGSYTAEVGQGVTTVTH